MNPTGNFFQMVESNKFLNSVTKLFILRPLLVDRWRITKQVSLFVPWCPYTESNKNVFSFLRNESVDRNSFTSVGSLFHVRGAETEKALLPIRRHVRGMTRSPHDEARNIHTVARLKIENNTCCSVQDSMKRRYRRSVEAGRPASTTLQYSPIVGGQVL